MSEFRTFDRPFANIELHKHKNKNKLSEKFIATLSIDMEIIYRLSVYPSFLFPLKMLNRML